MNERCDKCKKEFPAYQAQVITIIICGDCAKRAIKERDRI